MKLAQLDVYKHVCVKIASSAYLAPLLAISDYSSVSLGWIRSLQGLAILSLRNLDSVDKPTSSDPSIDTLNISVLERFHFLAEPIVGFL